MQVIAISEAETWPEEKWICTIALEQNYAADVMLNVTTGLSYVMQNADGSLVYDSGNGNTFPGYPLDEANVLAAAKTGFQEISTMLSKEIFDYGLCRCCQS